MQAIYDLVGDKLAEVLKSQDIDIRLYDPDSNRISYPFVKDRGRRIAVSPTSVSGVAKWVIESRQTWLVNEDMERRMAEIGSINIPGTQMEKSFIAVPIIAGAQVLGLVGIGNYEREHAFSDSDVRLLQTVVSAMSVALENARLFDETQRLLKETEQRAAELAVINSIQEGVAAELDFQNIVDLVGDKLREVLKTGEIGIRWFDYEEKVVHYLYEYEHGERLTIASRAPASDAWNEVTARRDPRIRNTAAETAAAGILPGTDPSKSNVAVPIIGSDRVIGSIIVEDYEREYAFSESDVRLLTTVASSMGVALENARLFDETQRLLKETEQRNAELAIINSVQAALAAELNIQGIYDAVGDKIREIFGNADMGIRIYDPKTEPDPLSLSSTRTASGSPLIPSRFAKTGFGAHVLRTRETLVINENMAQAMEKYGSYVDARHADGKIGWSWCRWSSATRRAGSINLIDMEREHAFSDSDVRLLQTLANSMSVALENARLFDETQRLLKETEQRAAELAIINSVQAALAAELNMQGIYDAVGDKIREIFHNADMGIRIYDPQTDLIHYPYVYENGKRIDYRSRSLLGDKGFAAHVLRTRETLVINEKMARGHREVRQSTRYPARRWRNRQSMCRWWRAIRCAG